MNKIHGQVLHEDMARSQLLPMPLVKQAAKEILTLIKEGLIRDGVVKVSNFGTFRLKPVAARQGINPQTREPITIPAHQRVIFSPCKALRELIQPEYRSPVPIASRQDNAVAGAAAMVSPAPRVSVNEHELGGVKDSEQRQNADIEPTTFSVMDVVEESKDASVDRLAQPDNPVQSDNNRLAMKTDSNMNSARAGINRHYLLGAAMLTILLLLGVGLLLTSDYDMIEGAVTTLADATENESHSVPRDAPIASENVGFVKEIQAAAKDLIKEDEINVSDIDVAVLSGVERGENGVEASDAAGALIMTMDNQNRVEKGVSADFYEGGYFFTEKIKKIPSGMSLWRLARTHYQDPLLWPHIYQANFTRSKNSDHLRAGSMITIPELQGPPERLSKTDRRNIAKGYYLVYVDYKKTGRDDAFFALLEAKRYDNDVVETYRGSMSLSQAEEIKLRKQPVMPF